MNCNPPGFSVLGVAQARILERVAISFSKGFPAGSSGKESACNVGDPGSIPQSATFFWRRRGQPTPEFVPGKSHGQDSPWGCKELDMTEQLTLLRGGLPDPGIQPASPALQADSLPLSSLRSHESVCRVCFQEKRRPLVTPSRVCHYRSRAGKALGLKSSPQPLQVQGGCEGAAPPRDGGDPRCGPRSLGDSTFPA